MQNLLVVVNHSSESSNALKVACRFKEDIKIHPVYVSPFPGYDLAIGAGWVRNTWVKESIRQARKSVRNLIKKRSDKDPNIAESIAVTGDPVKAVANQFVSNEYDMIIIGAPYHNLTPLMMVRKFHEVSKKFSKNIPLLVIQKPVNISKIIVFTDGGDSSAATLDFMTTINEFISNDITLIGVKNKNEPANVTNRLVLERGLAILKEKDIDAKGYTFDELGSEGLRPLTKKSDLLICPSNSEACTYMYRYYGKAMSAILFFIDK